ncbi:MAG: tyrosine-type recombinase/integrase [Kiritimatiellia bacterium]|nr:tyrosine-type recombinase/integrase [Kiritimatiellia bacterium]
MPLEIRKQKDGTLRSYWYGRYESNGKRYCVNLDVKIGGTPPDSLLQEGDTAFERSRAKAQAKLDQIVADVRSSKTAESLVQNLHEIKYGSKILSFPVQDLITAWDKMPKKRRSLHPRYIQDVHATIQRFVNVLKENHPDIIEAAQVTRQMALKFMDSETARNLSAKSWNDSLKRMKAIFKFLQIEYGVLRNPFEGIKAQEENHVHRQPFAEAEITKLLDAAKDDDFIRPLIVCGLSTAMRRGDCCLLKWSAVNMENPNPAITVKTSKTGQTVCIPIFEWLMNEFKLAQKTSFGKSEYVWPEQARMQLENQQGVTWRLRHVFENALGKDNLKVEREQGIRKASIKDFHSLRTTWITAALSRGVPIETVKLISGHRTTEVVTEHYFHPDLAQVRKSLESAIPKLLTNGHPGEAGKTFKDQMIEILDRTTIKTWKKDVARLRQLVAV